MWALVVILLSALSLTGLFAAVWGIGSVMAEKTSMKEKLHFLAYRTINEYPGLSFKIVFFTVVLVLLITLTIYAVLLTQIKEGAGFLLRTALFMIAASLSAGVPCAFLLSFLIGNHLRKLTRNVLVCDNKDNTGRYSVR